MSTQKFINNWLPNDISYIRIIVVYAGLGVFYTGLFFPVFYLIISTFKSNDILFSSELILFPSLSQLSLENWVTVLTRDEFRAFFINSTIIALGTTVLTLIVSIFGAYSLSRFKYKGHRSLILVFVSSQMLPRVLILIPFFEVVRRLQLINTYIGIILSHSVITIPFTIWLLKGYFDDIPEALDDAAKMDGCSELEVLWQVIIPLSLPGISVGAFYTFVGSWNDFLFVSMLSQSQATRTLPFALALFQSGNNVNWGATLTVAVITMIPVVLLFAFVQQYIMEGLAQGGTKGV